MLTYYSVTIAISLFLTAIVYFAVDCYKSVKYSQIYKDYECYARLILKYQIYCAEKNKPVIVDFSDLIDIYDVGDLTLYDLMFKYKPESLFKNRKKHLLINVFREKVVKET